MGTRQTFDDQQRLVAPLFGRAVIRLLDGRRGDRFELLDVPLAKSRASNNKVR